MSTKAVTPADPAQPNAVETHVQADDFAAYADEQNRRDVARFKGEPPKEDPAPSPVEVKPAAEVDAPAAPESDTAAASEAAQTQEPRRKTSATSESRWAKITRENRELRERLARLEEQRPEPRETKQEPRPAAEQKPPVNAKPKIDDIDEKTGQPKYKTYDDYLDARDSWLRGETQREFEEKQAKLQRETEQRQAQETISREWGNRVEQARAKHADYDQVALNPDLPIKQGSVVDVFILDSAHGTDVLYHLGQHPEELERINKLNPIAQARELTKIELKFSAPPARRITQAPPPVKTVSAQGSVGADEVDQALKEDDFDSYRAAQNARDLARRKGK